MKESQDPTSGQVALIARVILTKLSGLEPDLQDVEDLEGVVRTQPWVGEVYRSLCEPGAFRHWMDAKQSFDKTIPSEYQQFVRNPAKRHRRKM